MRTRVLLMALVLGIPGWAPASPEAFDYHTWTNKSGKSFVARIDHLKGDEVVLRAKQGGKRYTVKREVLSSESLAQLQKYIDEARADLAKFRRSPQPAVISSDLAYRAATLGQARDLLNLKGRSIAFVITRIRVEDRLKAILEFDGGCFRELRASSGSEYFIKQGDLYSRPVRKGRDYIYERGIDDNARLVLEKGRAYQLRLASGQTVEWARIGVSEGPVFR